MKALIYRVYEQEDVNPDNCVPYGGLVIYDILKPLDTDKKAFEMELAEAVANDNSSVGGYSFDGEIDLGEDEAWYNTGDEIMNEEDYEMHCFGYPEDVNEFGEAI